MEEAVARGRRGKTQRMAARPRAVTAAEKQLYLDVLAATGNASRAAERCGRDRTAMWKLRQRDMAFGQACEMAIDDAARRLEADNIAEAMGTAFDPATGDVLPRLTLSDRLKVLASHRASVAARGAARAAQSAPGDPAKIRREMMRWLKRWAEKLGTEVPV